MKIREIASIVKGTILCSAECADNEVSSACAFDMMSDVLAYVRDQSVLITGLINPQVVRTAVMVDISCIVFVCGKTPDVDMMKLAENYNIVFIATDMSTYEAAGVLYGAGLKA
ncbi:MAG: DRTGG domain-containing protein [Acutalibacteraceae bacterium]